MMAKMERCTKIFWLFITSFLLVSCNNNKHSNQSVSREDSFRIIHHYLQAKKREGIKFHKEGDSRRTQSLKLLDFPDLQTLNREAYIFYWSKVPIDQPGFAYLLEEVSKENYRLTSKCVYDWGPNQDTIKIPLNGKILPIWQPTVLEGTVQKVSSREWWQFKEILGGSYYWAFESPCLEGDGILDGNSFILESKSMFCIKDSLTYHVTYVHVPKRGSFKEACTFLIKLSKLTKNIHRTELL
jgi:hypothetical protein